MDRNKLRQTVTKLLSQLEDDYEVDAREIAEAAASYIFSLVGSLANPGDKEMIARLEEMETPTDLGEILDAVNEAGKEELNKRNLASDLGYKLGYLLRDVIVATVLKKSGV